MSKYAKLSAGLLAAWLVFSLFSSALHLYRNAPNTPPIAFGIAVVTPIVLFLVWFASSPGFRQFVLSLSPRTLTLVQSMRIAGFVFLVLGTYCRKVDMGIDDRYEILGGRNEVIKKRCVFHIRVSCFHCLQEVRLVSAVMDQPGVCDLCDLVKAVCPHRLLICWGIRPIRVVGG